MYASRNALQIQNTKPEIAGNHELQRLICELGEDEINANACLDAHSFLRALEQHFCVVSGSVGKLYEHYELCPSQQPQKSYVAIPETRFGQQALSGVSNDALEDLNAYVMDGSLVGLKGLALALHEGSEFITLPLEDGLAKLRNQYSGHGDCLPVLSSRDLRAVNDFSIVRLNRLVLDSIPAHLRERLENAVWNKPGLTEMTLPHAA